MSPSTDPGFAEALAALVAALREVDAPAMIIGGIAAIGHGIPRQTSDVDVTVWGEGLDLRQLAAALARHGIEPRIADAVGFAERQQTLLLRHTASETPIDVTIAWLPFERDALARAVSIRYAGIEIPVTTPEDLLVYKALAWRDRDRSDIERLLILHGENFDLERIRGFVRQFAEVLDDPGRVAAFEEIVARVSS